VWEAALASTWQEPGVWVHGDVAANNLLVLHRRLAAVIDFGSSGVGDPACDLTILWTFFSGAARGAFRDAMAMDDATWARARGWASWKALISMRAGSGGPRAVREATRVLGAVLAEP
jgi:aminoglycoside phosphotransferase (APT) family kinase protein